MATKNTDLPEGTDTVIDGAAKTGEPGEPGTVKKATAKLKEEAGKVTSQAADKARGVATENKAKATGALKDVSKAMDDASKSVDERLGESYGEYGRMAAGAIASFADKIDGKEVDDLIKDAQDMVRKSPVIAIGLAAVAGFAVARLVKSGMGSADTDGSSQA